ncbi:MAG: hypothetical protein F4Y02_14370 [Chloroflexi bacterium]|nr:hypothetical protein [Chloroflexota bacterium]
MPSPFAIYTPRSTSVAPLVGLADGYLSEDHEIAVDVTRFPVESGATLGDHAVKRPDRLRLVGWTSDLYPSDAANISETDRPAQAWAEIRRLAAAREPLEVVTILGVYEDMLIVRATAPVSMQTARGLLFTVEFEEVQTAPLQRVEFTIPIRPTASGPAADRVPPTGGADDELAQGPTTYSPTAEEVLDSADPFAFIGDLANVVGSTVQNILAAGREGDVGGVFSALGTGSRQLVDGAGAKIEEIRGSFDLGGGA